MDNRSELLLRRMIRNWVNRQRPPDYGRARLIWEAAYVSRQKADLSALIFRPQFKTYHSSTVNDWHQTLFAWINENSMQTGFQARLG